MSLLRHASTVVSLTLLSRGLGFARDAAVAALFGTGAVADASVAGLAIPQLARRLLGEGALNAAILPRLPAASAGPAPRLAGALILVFTLAAVLIAALLALFMPQVTALLAPGFLDDPARAEGAVLAGRIAMLALPLAAGAGVLAALVNAAGRVTRPAFAPAAGNLAVLAVIGAFAFFHAGTAEDVGSRALAFLAVATVAGALAQAMVIGAALPHRPGTLLPDRAALKAALPVLIAAGPTLFAAALPQLRILVANAGASELEGGVSALFYATRLVELPLGLVGASAGAVLLPALAAHGRAEDPAGHSPRGHKLLGDALVAALALTAPAAAGLALLAEPIVRVLFQRGAFDAAAAALTAEALAMLALSLPLQAMERILSTAAFAQGLGRLVTRTSVAALLAGGGIGFAAAGPLGLAGPALGVVASSLVALAGLWVGLARAGLLRLGGGEWRLLAGCLLATLAMAVMVGLGAHLLAAPLAAGGLHGTLTLGLLVLAGIAVYGLAARSLGLLPRR
ncbi:putative peptidoglycan lipid II flippase [Ancylobacter sp. 3268]|uniref:murein biosynthesis integral membrane protein MurJ n=1 Tax=Ancylobacter sp. 3268 TaxID=2817752 RepID=UPI002866A2D9|nr:lipid II flippase MurJ [Ancylobacter sp. 3268]MDR6953488.1 putative peptidoglycan lipid II flippase [Ancylobacter sp. 3268]